MDAIVSYALIKKANQGADSQFIDEFLQQSGLRNIVVNTDHPDSQRIQLIHTEPFYFDPRLS